MEETKKGSCGNKSLGHIYDYMHLTQGEHSIYSVPFQERR